MPETSGDPMPGAEEKPNAPTVIFDGAKQTAIVAVAVLIALAMICATVLGVAIINGGHKKDQKVACFKYAKDYKSVLSCQGIEPYNS